MAIVPHRIDLEADTAGLILANAANRAQSLQGEDDYTSIRYKLKVPAGSPLVYLGGDDTVDDSVGYEWDPDAEIEEGRLEPGEELWGYATADVTIHVLTGGR